MRRGTCVLMDNFIPQPTPKRLDWVCRIHKLSGLLCAPFLLISIVLAVGLTHSKLLDRLSCRLFETKPIPSVSLHEPLQPGSWGQAMKLAKLAMGCDASFLRARDNHHVVVQGFKSQCMGAKTPLSSRRTALVVDTRTMKIVRIEDKSNSLVSMGLSIHDFRFFDISWFSIASISAVSLSVLLMTGGVLAMRDRKAGRQYSMPVLLHVRLGQTIGLFIVIIVLTTLHFEFQIFGKPDNAGSLPIPVLSLSEPVRPGSMDQARRLAELAINAPVNGVFCSRDGNLRFSEYGDGFGGKSILINANAMTVKRITDWSNFKTTLIFYLHDGRWLGGMNALNVNDVVALLLLFLIFGGTSIAGRNRRARLAAVTN